MSSFRSIAKNVLRQRIYSASLDYFCSEKSFPTQSGVALSEDITIMIKFWSSMHQDKKHIRSSAVGDLELIGGQSVAEGPALSTGGALTLLDNRSVSSEFRPPSVAGGWNNQGSTYNASQGNNTMNKRSASRAAANRPAINESFVKVSSKVMRTL